MQRQQTMMSKSEPTTDVAKAERQSGKEARAVAAAGRAMVGKRVKFKESGFNPETGTVFYTGKILTGKAIAWKDEVQCLFVKVTGVVLPINVPYKDIKEIL